MEAYEFIENHELVLAAFGRWPGFHDGEVHKMLLDRTRQLPNGKYYASVELFIRGWNMVGPATNEYLYRLENDSLVHFLFEHVSDLELDGLNTQNVISGLDFNLSENPGENAPTLIIEVNHCYGLSGGFKALRASVISVTPIVASCG
ncbi:Imm50 family immunity protein [Janthinobacterium sp. P210006]|uniref:Imm50 family immunity protein n=1 Tax=Janthinobacterium sp. P210006 TaxID=3112939 RepID=UPI002E26C652|nr:Imm50 family immunity protein [Janthinobacterium sp. P210006]